LLHDEYWVLHGQGDIKRKLAAAEKERDEAHNELEWVRNKLERTQADSELNGDACASAIYRAESAESKLALFEELDWDVIDTAVDEHKVNYDEYGYEDNMPDSVIRSQREYVDRCERQLEIIRKLRGEG
jgi:uncharacterized membrane protein YukC